MVFFSKTLLKFLGLLSFFATCVVVIIVTWATSRAAVTDSSTGCSSSPVEQLDGKFEHAAVVASAPPCATIGKEILRKGGKAVDAMIGAMLCDGLTLPQSMGIGGGFFMVIYNKKTGNISTINARETAPAAATENMFGVDKNSTKSQLGSLSIAVPGEIKGYWTAFKKYGGGITWQEIFDPIIRMCEEGIPIDESLADVLIQNQDFIKVDREFSALFLDPKTKNVLRAGMKYRNEKLAKTLRKIAIEGGDAFYKGEIAGALVSDIKEQGGIITEDDLANYEVEHMEKISAMPIFNDYSLYAMEPPASGLVLAYILRLMNGFVVPKNELINTQRITEAFKYAYGIRTHLGDRRFVNTSQVKNQILSDEFIKKIRANISDTSTSNDPKHYGAEFANINDKGTANLAVLHENGDAVVATSTINLRFGSRVLSKRTGIILNDEMDDFSLPDSVNYFGLAPSPVNYIKPGKRPMSSMCPSIILDENGDVKLLIGGAGGTRITTGVAITILRTLLLDESLREAMDKVLYHHQLIPMTWFYYPETPQDLIENMKKIGHKTKISPTTSFTAVTAIHKKDGVIYANCDRKRPGHIDGY